ncbi:MAG: di-heme oxidoredictase family protein [Candidatus Acidiferrum sp.]|jgi:CxxC motif-containing protein (DUF1111 family)
MRQKFIVPLIARSKPAPTRKFFTGLVFILMACSASVLLGQMAAHDPGVRGGTVDSGQPLASVAETPGATDFFSNGLARFIAVDVVKGGTNNGLGPRFNSNQCASCHIQPSVGGSSPSINAFPFLGQNPQVEFQSASNSLPGFITPQGPVREARFKFFLNNNGSLSNTPDGGVHDLFVISGRPDAGTCAIKQPNFAQNLALNNVSFRIPTPVFGAGLLENIPDEAILANLNGNAAAKNQLGISGQANRDGNDGAITRFGWKAQNKSLEIFAGEAYNVEMGVTSELFQNERASPDESLRGGLPANCRINPTPEDATNMTASPDYAVPSDTVQFAMFMRLLAPPTPSTSTPGGATSISNGSHLFQNAGCALCHTTSLPTAPSSFTPGLGPGTANLFSDLLVHHMGSNLADGVTQGLAGPDEFRSAPLWGLGQRVFFLHDGRTTDLMDAIFEHASQGSEANGVIRNFKNLNPQQQQDLLNFLRSL